ncbi:MAG: hypothetical protein ACRCWR_02715 [Saezia sp.]
MAKTTKIQIPCDQQLYASLEQEKEKTGSSSLAHTCRQLLEFALMIKARSEASEAKTNRELLEEILLSCRENEEILKQTYLNVFDVSKSSNQDVLSTVQAKVVKLKERGKVQFDVFMETEKKA